MKLFFPRSVIPSKTASTFVNSKYVNQAQSGKNNFEEDFKNSHINTNLFQKILLGVGSGIISITSPSRGDMIAVMGEVTGPQALRYIQSEMQKSDEGKQILEERPRITSGAIDLEKLKTYPPGTLGKAYSNFLNRYGYTPDSRNAVKFVDDLELAYVAQRYREVHDLFHTLLDMPTNMLGEVTVKWVEAIQTKLPMCAAGALFGSIRLAPKFVRRYSTKAVVQIYPEYVEKFKSGELKPRQFVKELQLKSVALPEPIITGIKSVIDYEKKNVLKNSKWLNNYLQHRKVPLEDRDKNQIEKMFAKKLTTLYPENFELDSKLADEYDRKLNKMISNYIKSHIWKPITYTKFLGLQYLMRRAPAEYAALRQVFHEISVKDKNFSPITFLDFGSGVGTAVWAAHDLWGSNLKEYICIDKSKEMNNIAELILKNNNLELEPFVKKVHYRQFLPKNLSCDIVVSAFSFFELPNQISRLKTLTHLWNNTDNYLVLLENGTNEGFQILMEARSYLLEVSAKNEIDCHVFAPCPHESSCPRLSAPGKLTPCNFTVKYKNIYNFKELEHVDNQFFSYLVLKKAKKPLQESRESRIVRETKKRHHCVVCHLCTNYEDLKTIFISRGKYGKDVYALFKHLKWGDSIPGNLYLKEPNVDNKEYIFDRDSDDDMSDLRDKDKADSSAYKEEYFRNDAFHYNRKYTFDKDFSDDSSDEEKELIIDNREYISDRNSDSDSSDSSDEDKEKYECDRYSEVFEKNNENITNNDNNENKKF